MTTCKIVTKENGFSWMITIYDMMDGYSEIPTYTSVLNHEWKLRLDTQQEHLIVSIKCIVSNVQDFDAMHDVKFSCTYWDNYGTQQGVERMKIQKPNEEKSFRCIPIGANLRYQDHIFIEKCTVDISWEVYESVIVLAKSKCCSSSKAFLDYFSSLFNNSKFTDVVLKVRADELRAHKVILSASSDVFEAMFEHNMKENESGCVDIIDFGVEVIREMLRFMYTKEKPILNGKIEAEELYRAANKYNVEGLKEACGNYFASTLNESNAMDMLQFADMHSDEKLKHTACSYIHDHPFCTADAKKWESICKNPKLCQYLYQFKVSRSAETESSTRDSRRRSRSPLQML